MASTGPGSMSSMASADIFAMKPTERIASAKMPAIAPRPTTATKNSAHTISWMDRLSVIMSRASG